MSCSSFQPAVPAWGFRHLDCRSCCLCRGGWELLVLLSGRLILKVKPWGRRWILKFRIGFCTQVLLDFIWHSKSWLWKWTRIQVGVLFRAASHSQTTKVYSLLASIADGLQCLGLLLEYKDARCKKCHRCHDQRVVWSTVRLFRVLEGLEQAVTHCFHMLSQWERHGRITS